MAGRIRSHAYIAVLDANSKDKLLVTGSKTLQTPSRFYKQENAPSVILNAGFLIKMVVSVPFVVMVNS